MMAPGKIAYLVLVISILDQVACNNPGVNVTKVCKIQSQMNQNGFWQKMTEANKLEGKNIFSFTVCCDGYVFNGKTPVCNSCPAKFCIYGYCPPDDSSVNCHCYRDMYYGTSDACVPICTPIQNCSHGNSCNTGCTCQEGYTKDVRTKFCVPTECFERCTNGVCNRIGTCIHCNESNEKNAECLLMNCQQSCSNGRCNEKGVCICIKGFKKANDFVSCNKITCPSAHNDTNDELFCESECKLKCMNGICNAAGKCTCKTGFKTRPNNLFQCQKINCPGSVHDDTETNLYCKDVCDKTCINGECSAEGVCYCKTGYLKHLEKPYTCSPACKEGCKNNSLCTGPDSCSCATGYVEIVSGGSCVKKCIADGDCAKGKCSQNDGKCSCQEGYHLLKTNKCVPLCVPECTNGNCTGFNECICNDLFVNVNGSCVDQCNELMLCSFPAKFGLAAAIGTLFVIATVIGVSVAWKVNRRKRISLNDTELEFDSFGFEMNDESERSIVSFE